MKRACQVLSVLVVFFVSTTAFAQATRTWVSGVGDDANPCSRTAPCKTWAGTISKTAAGGEMNALDPGGFGTLNITKSITIDGNGVLASTLASGTNGFIINGLNIDVTLRNLTINGGNTGLRGVRVIQARNVMLQNLDIFNFSERGISIESTVATKVNVQNCRISNPAALASGVTIQPTSGSPVNQLVIFNSNITNNGNRGVYITNGGNATVKDSNISNNSLGVVLEQTAGGARVNLDNNIIANNGTGFTTQAGTIMLLSGNSVYGNATNAFNVAVGTAFSFGDNFIDGNGPQVGTLSPANEQ